MIGRAKRAWLGVTVGLLACLSVGWTGGDEAPASDFDRLHSSLPYSNLPGWAEHMRATLLEESGEPGLAVFPANFEAGEATAIRDPREFSVILVKGERPDDRRSMRAGYPAPPPSGRWHLWLESEWEISPGAEVVVFPEAAGWRVVHPRLMAVEPGGRVGAPKGSGDSELWLVHAELPGPSGPFGQLARRHPLAEIEDGILMPAGRTLAGLWNPETERYEAVSRPFEVVAGEQSVPSLEAPSADQAFLVVEVSHGHPRWRDEDGTLEIEVRRGDEVLPAEEWVVTPEATYAVWYGLAPGVVEISGGGEHHYFQETEVVLTEGAIHHLTESWVPRPLLDVSVVLPQELRQGSLSLAVYRTEGARVLAERELGPRQSRARFHLLHAEVTVELRTVHGTYRRVVDLREETEASILLEPDLIRLTGELLQGGQPVAGRLHLHTTDGHRVELETGEDGGFETLALRPVYWAAVHLPDEEEPWMETWMPPIAEDRHLMIDIPAADVSVRVVNATSGERVPGARVDVESHYRPGDALEDSAPEAVGSEERSSSERMMARMFTADEDGLVELPPPRSGRLEIRASAEGYHPVADPLVVPIPDPPVDREILLPLQPLGPGAWIRLRLPDGRPAMGAELLAVRGVGDTPPALPLRTGPRGDVEIPVDAGVTHLLVRHPATASRVLPWPLAEESEWYLEPVAAMPLRLKVEAAGGGEAVAMARPILWFEGVAVTGSDLRWLLEARSFTGPRGHWTTTRLPARPLRVLATDYAGQQELRSLPNLATEVTYPWPPVLVLELVR